MKPPYAIVLLYGTYLPLVALVVFYCSFLFVVFKKNLNESKPSEHPPHHVEEECMYVCMYVWSSHIIAEYASTG